MGSTSFDAGVRTSYIPNLGVAYCLPGPSTSESQVIGATLLPCHLLATFHCRRQQQLSIRFPCVSSPCADRNRMKVGCSGTPVILDVTQEAVRPHLLSGSKSPFTRISVCFFFKLLITIRRHKIQGPAPHFRSCEWWPHFAQSMRCLDPSSPTWYSSCSRCSAGIHKHNVSHYAHAMSPGS